MDSTSAAGLVPTDDTSQEASIGYTSDSRFTSREISHPAPVGAYVTVWAWEECFRDRQKAGRGFATWDLANGARKRRDWEKTGRSTGVRFSGLAVWSRRQTPTQRYRISHLEDADAYQNTSLMLIAKPTKGGSHRRSPTLNQPQGFG